MPVPTRVGYTVGQISFGSGVQTGTINLPAGVQPGDQIIFFAEWSGGLPSGVRGGNDWPMSWTNIEHENHGTRGYTVWHAGTHVSGSTLTYQFNAPSASKAMTGVMVIRGAAPFSDWVIGQWWDRNGLGGGIMNTTTRALSVSAPSNSLVLSLHGEATNAAETSASGISGAAKWFESPAQPTTNVDIERIYVSYRESVTAESTPTVDVTWPNSAQNGAAMQVAIPGLSEAHDYPTVQGATSLRHTDSAVPAQLPIASIDTGNWMIVSAMSSSSAQVITAPSGWTTLVTRETTGTRRNFLFGKVKTALDGATADFTQAAASTVAYGLLWGINGAEIDRWQVGLTTPRSTLSDPSGSRYKNRATSITTAYANSLAIAISHEATLAMDQTNEVASYTAGWSQNLYLAQVAVNDRIETLWYGSKVMETVGATGDIDITYISPQDNNGWAVQIEIPNANAAPSVEAPYVVASYESASGASGVSLTFTKPTELQNGDMLVAILRCQTSGPAPDWTASGTAWTQVGTIWPGSSGSRLNSTFTRVVSNAAAEPSTYTFTKTTNDSNRRVGHIIVIRSDSGVPAYDTGSVTYGGVDPVGNIDRAADVYTINTPSLEILWAASEFASPQDHAINVYPDGATTIRYTTTSTNTGISRTTLYSGWVLHSSGTMTSQIGVDWVGGPSGPAAGSISFVTGEMPDQTGTGYLMNNGQGRSVKTYYTSAHGYRSPQEIIPIRRGFSSVAEMLATPGFTWAHRGGSTSWPEMSLHAYTQAVTRGYGVLEVSLGRTSDGVWFGLHDQSTDRTSGGTYGNASSQTWAQIQAQQNTHGPGGPQPYMRWEEIVAAYGKTHVIVADPKYALGSYRTEFLNMVNTDLGPTKAIIKYSGGGSGAANLSTQAQLLGFQTWGFFYAADASAGLGGTGALQTWGPSWTLIGMEYGASQAIWDEALALGRPVIGHITPTQAAYDTAIAKGASGVQVSGVAAVEPISWWTNIPIASWEFTEGTGTAAKDLHGSRDLVMAASNWAVGHSGSGLSSAGGMVAIPNKLGLESQKRTLMFWANWSGNGGDWRWGVDFHLTALDTSCWGIMPINGSGELYCRIRIGGVNTNITINNSANDGSWHHYAITYNGTNFIAYRDGIVVGTVPITGIIDSCDEIVVHPAGGTNIIDDLRIFNRALTQAQITSYMNN